MKESFLEVYDLTLTTRTPLFVGSGEKYTVEKNEDKKCINKQYIYKKNKVIFLNEDRFIRALVEKKLVDAYEEFIQNKDMNLLDFLKCHEFTDKNGWVSKNLISRKISTESDFREGNINTFQRNANGAYVPGSSVKGALRTVWLMNRVLKDKSPHTLPSSNSAKSTKIDFPEKDYVNLLPLRKDENGAIADDIANSIFRGISVSDSLPISDNDLFIGGKHDVYPSGEEKKKQVPMYRECVSPKGVSLHFKLTLDQSILKGRITKESLLEDIKSFDHYYKKTYEDKFKRPQNANAITAESAPGGMLILGGGAGFFSKSLAYPYLDEKQGLDWVSQRLDKLFPKNGNHGKSKEKEISPHMMKYTSYNGQLYPYGYCEVDLR